MAEYAKTHPDISGSDFAGEFSLLNIHPEGDNIGGNNWDLCAWFLEPKTDHPKLILIFKRQA
jgi:hypothetical protein